MNIYLLCKKWYLSLIVVFFSLLSFASFGQISVTATAGTLSGSYTTLGAAFTAINAGTHQGVITISVTASTTETTICQLNASGSGSASYTSVLVKPATGVTATINSNIATNGTIYLYGADNVTIDGSNTVGGTTRNLTIQNTSASSAYVIRLGSPSTTNGATNNVIKNCIITNGSSTGSGTVVMGGSGVTLYAAGEGQNSNNTIQNNAISGAQEGVYDVGPAALDNGWVIDGNTITGCGFDGILLYYHSNFTVSNNSISGITINGASQVTGIIFSWTLSGGNIFNNKIDNIANTAANGCYGIYFDLLSTASNVNVYNNFISNVRSSYSSSYWLNGYGIFMDAGGGINFYHNTVNLNTNQTGILPALGTTAAICFDPYTTGAIATNSIKVVDNIFNVTQTTGSRYGIYCTVSNTIFNTINYNDYYAPTALGYYIGTSCASVAAIQTNFGGNLNSITYNPAFVTVTSPSDLHLTTAAANNVLAAGTPITSPSITVDIDGATRSATAPTMGADEIINNTISYTTLASTCSTGDVILSGVSITSGAGVPTTGTTVPQIYFKKGVAGTWYHSSGTLTGGTATAGTWSFTITAATMGGVAGGDVIYYYVVAQTVGGTVFANPTTGLVATDVNTVTTPPTTPNNYTVNAVSVSGLTSSQTVCYNQGTVASTVSYTYSGSLGSPNQYTLTWSPAGPTDVTAFTAMASPINVSVPAGTAAGTYTGTLTIKNSTTGCTNTYTVTLIINPAPSAITGLFSLCSGGATTTLTSATSGGSWNGGSVSVATIGASGMVTSVGVGTTTVTYSAPITGCTDTAIVTVISTPNPITGPTAVCTGSSISLGETTGGGSWSSSNTARATVDASGNVYGVSSGSVTISYVMPSGCFVVYALTVNTSPAAIAGLFSLCSGGATTTLTNSTGGGSWSGGSISVATVGSSGMVTSVGAGTTIITYTLPVSGCSDTALVSVISSPNPITGPTSLCIGGTVSLGETTGGGSWSSSNTARATVDASGVVYGVTAGAVTISYVMPSGCYALYAMTVGATPVAIGGPSTVCPGDVISLTHPISTGTWTSSPTSIATITSGGVVGGASAGNADITYAISPGCNAYRTVTVNPLPAAITGAGSFCAGSTLTLSDASTPGVWSTSGFATIATVNGSTGVVTGIGAGSIIVTYTATVTGCRATASVSVHPLPAPIGGATTICGGGATGLLTETSGTGTWVSGDMAIATVVSGTGLVTGVAAGNVTITFTQTSTGCQATTVVTILPTPAIITGSSSVCAGGSIITLSNTSTGNWSITPLSVATITTGGMVTGVTAGAATATYTGTNSCYVIKTIIVNPLPAAITGPTSVCQSSTITLTSTPGGTWAVGNPFVATVVGTGGGIYGIAAGTSPITYTLSTGCVRTTTVTVNAIPGPIGGSPSICIGGVSTLTNSVGGGTWSATPAAIVTISASGVAYGASLGGGTVTYTNGTAGCYVTMPVTVTGIVAPTIIVSASPSATICAGTPVTYSAALGNGGASPLYVWSVNNVILSGASSYSYTPADGDIVRCWFISSYACASPDTASHYVVMHVNPIVTPSVSLTTGMGDTVCTPGITTLTPIPVAGGTAPVYNWWVNGVPAGSGPIYPYAPTNGDLILCRMTSNAPCATSPTAIATKILTVSPYVTPVVTLNSMLGLVTCDGYPDVFTTAQVNGGANPTYQWFVNGVGSGTGSNFTYTPVNGDVVQVTMTSNFPCLATPTASANMSLTVLPITQPVGVITAVPGYIVAAGAYDTFTCTITSGGGLAPLYQWYVNSVPVTGATNNIYITNVLHTGDSVSCEVTNTDQCSGVSVFGNMQITVGSNVSVGSIAGNMDVALLPNPNNGSFRVKGLVGNGNNVHIEIVNMLGQKVYSTVAPIVNGSLDEQIDLKGKLANGMYTLNLQAEESAKVFHFVLEQ